MFKNLFAASAITACLFAGTVAITTPAHAQSIRVSTTGLDLANPADRATLERRIARASAALCDKAGANLDSGVRNSQRACREETMRAAIAAVEARQGMIFAGR
jgi:UrcA family protein